VIILVYKNARDYIFELKSKERETDFCIELGLAAQNAVSKKFKVTNTHGLTRVIDSSEVKSVQYMSTFKSIDEVFNKIVGEKNDKQSKEK